MFLYIELWKPRAAWENLAAEQRQEFLSRLEPAARQMEKLGVELTGFAAYDGPVTGDAPYRYMAVWKMPNEGHIHMLDKAVRSEGWANYFDIVSTRGRIVPVTSLVEDMMKV